MAGRSVTVELPDDLYERLQRRAVESQRSLGDEVIEVLRASEPPEDDGIRTGLEAELTRLETLDDASLWKIARRRIFVRKSRRMESLNFKRQDCGLNAAERRVSEQLLAEFDRHMLIRAHVLLLLKQRGYDIDTFLFGQCAERTSREQSASVSGLRPRAGAATASARK
jgi:plasmid stability protein